MTETTSITLFAAALAAIALAGAWVCWRLTKGPGGNVVMGLLWVAVRVYCRIMHRTRYEGLGKLPRTNAPGGLIVVANHTSPIDPLLIQAACRFQIRWMMAREMMVEKLDWLWRRADIIPVDRDGKDLSAAREAIRHIRNGGVLGIFPEGGLVRPQGEVRPFAEGVGFIIAKTRAPVLLTWIRDTPAAMGMVPALRSPSRSKVSFVEMMRFDDQERPRPAEVTERLRQGLAEVSGWPLNDEPRVAREQADPPARQPAVQRSA